MLDDSTLNLVRLATAAAQDKKAFELAILDVSEVTSFTDAFVLCSTSSDRHLRRLPTLFSAACETIGGDRFTPKVARAASGSSSITASSSCMCSPRTDAPTTTSKGCGATRSASAPPISASASPVRRRTDACSSSGCSGSAAPPAAPSKSSSRITDIASLDGGPAEDCPLRSFPDRAQSTEPGALPRGLCGF